MTRRYRSRPGGSSISVFTVHAGIVERPDPFRGGGIDLDLLVAPPAKLRFEGHRKAGLDACGCLEGRGSMREAPIDQVDSVLPELRLPFSWRSCVLLQEAELRPGRFNAFRPTQSTQFSSPENHHPTAVGVRHRPTQFAIQK